MCNWAYYQSGESEQLGLEVYAKPDKELMWAFKKRSDAINLVTVWQLLQGLSPGTWWQSQ